MKSFYYDVPESMTKEKDQLLEYIDVLIEHFNKRAETIRNSEREERKKKAAAREWRYLVRTEENGWSYLYKEAIEPVEGEKDNEQWSKYFQIINGVLVLSEYSPSNRSWTTANKLLVNGSTGWKDITDFTSAKW